MPRVKTPPHIDNIPPFELAVILYKICAKLDDCERRGRGMVMTRNNVVRDEKFYRDMMRDIAEGYGDMALKRFIQAVAEIEFTNGPPPKAKVEEAAEAFMHEVNELPANFALLLPVFAKNPRSIKRVCSLLNISQAELRSRLGYISTKLEEAVPVSMAYLAEYAASRGLIKI